MPPGERPNGCGKIRRDLLGMPVAPVLAASPHKRDICGRPLPQATEAVF
jgi:hypothetical protein